MTGVERESKEEKYKVNKSLCFWDFEGNVL